MNNYVHKGKTLTVTAPYNVSSGGGCLVGGTIFGVASFTVLSGASLEIEVEGVYDLAKDSSTFVEGAPVYWDNTALACTSSLGNASGPNTLIGVAELVQASGTNALGGSSGDATVRVRLNAKFDNPGIKRFHCTYNFAVDGGAEGTITPAENVTIPAQTVLLASLVNSTTAVTSGGSATVEIGTTAGSSATSILGSTAKATLSANALIEGAVTPAAPVKMSAAGQVQLTVGVAALTAGVIEIELWGFISPS
jgi:predicted RecA/RadA family phage recombinase